MRVRRVLVSLVSTTAVCALVGGTALAGPATADTDPPSGQPATVSVDPLPTVQVNGIVWAQELVGNTVYATGSFTRARPAGSALGENEVVRENLLAFDIRTGALLPFDHRLNGAGHALSASPDGRKLYVGGDFTTVDGAPHARVAAFNLRNGSLVGRFKGSTTDRVKALAASDSGVYAAGDFMSARGKNRQRLAKFDRAGRVTRWSPKANNSVRALLLTPDQRRVIVGGNFTKISRKWFWGFAAVRATSGRPILTWKSHDRRGYPLRNGGDGSGITSLSQAGGQLFLTGYSAGRKFPVPEGRFEGRAAVSLKNGQFNWISDCQGDSYDTVPVGNVLYSVGHPHNCQAPGYYPERGDRPRRALAETVYPTHVNGTPPRGYSSFAGRPAPDQLVWYPSLSAGTVSGSSQAAWDIVGNQDYLSLGGEFPAVEGVEQQGLVRFAVRSLAPNRVGPESYSGNGVVVEPADEQGVSRVSWNETWDKDNARLSYQLYRESPETLVCSFADVDSRFWQLEALECSDTGRDPGTIARYRLVVTDAFGNITTTRSPSVN